MKTLRVALLNDEGRSAGVSDAEEREGWEHDFAYYGVPYRVVYSGTDPGAAMASDPDLLMTDFGGLSTGYGERYKVWVDELARWAADRPSTIVVLRTAYTSRAWDLAAEDEGLAELANVWSVDEKRFGIRSESLEADAEIHRRIRRYFGIPDDQAQEP